MALEDDLGRIATAAAAYAAAGERVEAVLAAEPASRVRVYLCAYSGAAERTWLALDTAAEPVTSRALVREAVSIAALCELADELAGREPEARLATPAYLDEVGTPDLAGAFGTVESLTEEVESFYKEDLR